MINKKAAQRNNNANTKAANRESGILYLTLLRRAGLFALLWWILNPADYASWLIGIPCIVAAVTLSVKFAPPHTWRWRPLHVVRFVPIFLWESLRGGIDVSLRVFRPRMALHPAVIHYHMALPGGLPRLLMLNVVSLLPGTLSADLHANRLTLHVLDKNMPLESELHRIEKHIASMINTTTEAATP
jgi:multicomponent Na+:H+ antiporter subunit E